MQLVEEAVKIKLAGIYTEIQVLRNQNKDQYYELELLKQYGRRNAIRVHSPKWVELPGEDTDKTVLTFFQNVLNLDIN